MRARALTVALVLVSVPLLAGCLGADEEPGTGTDGDGGEGAGGAAGAGGFAPVAQFALTPDTGGADTTFTFDASRSTDPDGGALTYAWEIGTIAKKSGQKVTHRFGFTDATILVKLTVTDPAGLSATAAKPLKLGTGVNNAPTLSVVATPAWVKPGDEVTVVVEGADPEGDAVTYALGFAEGGASAVVDSGDIAANGRWTHTYAEEGTYLLHCHPHPFMKHNVTVLKGAKAPAGGKLDVQIKDFRYAPENVAVPPGTVIAYLNKDQVVHTVTLEKYSPELATVPLTDGKGTVKFPADGRYKLVATATDVKGAAGTAETTVLVDAARPDDTYAAEWTGHINATIAGTPLSAPGRHSFKLAHPGTGTLTLEFTSTVPGLEMTLTLGSSDGGTTELTASGASPVTLPVDIGPGTYTAVVSAERAANVDYTVAAALALVLTPPSEDGGGGDGHDHAH